MDLEEPSHHDKGERKGVRRKEMIYLWGGPRLTTNLPHCITHVIVSKLDQMILNLMGSQRASFRKCPGGMDLQ